MLKRYFTYFVILITISFYGQSTPSEMVTKMSRGINIGNVLSAPKEGNWAPALTESYLEDVKAAGFKTIRIPIDFFGDRTSGDTSGYSKSANTSSSYTGNSSDYIIKNSYLDRVEQVLNWSLNNDLITILDFHGATVKEEFLYTFSSKSKWSAYYTHPSSAKRKADNQKFRAIWTQIANRFKDYSDNLLFEVINEPYFWLSDNEMDVLNSDIISIIRNSGNKNSDRNIIITGGSKNSYEAPLQISNSVINSDDNLIATFHYYWPRAFTASSGEDDNDFNWGTANDKTDIDTNFNAVKVWSQNKNIPILLGEFGADNERGYNYVKKTYSPFGGPDKASREEFHGYLADKAIDLGFSFTVWDAGDKANKTVYKASDRTWVTGVKDALLGADNPLNIENINNSEVSFSLSPIPTNQFLNIRSSKKIKNTYLQTINGKSFIVATINNRIDLSNFKNGIYFLKTIFKDNTINHSKILITNKF